MSCFQATRGTLKNTPTMVKKLLHTRYRVADLEKTVSFYKEVLGLAETGRSTSVARVPDRPSQGAPRARS